jgi:hypothetical protein
VDDAQRAVGQNDPVLHAVGLAFPQRLDRRLADPLPVLRMHAGEEPLGRGLECARLVAEDAEHLVRPRQPSAVEVERPGDAGEIQLPAPEARDPLRFGEARLAPA